MEVRLLALVGYWVSSAVLGAWFLEQVWGLVRRISARGFRNQPSGRPFMVNDVRRATGLKSPLLTLTGMVMGGFAVIGLERWVSAEGLLLLLVVIVICAHEFKRSGSEVDLLSIITLFYAVRTQPTDGADGFGLLTKAVGALPEGKLQKALREAVLKRQSGNSAAESLDALKGIHACLDEFILTMRLLNGKTGPAWEVALDRLSSRAGRQWDRESRWLVLKERASTFTRYLQIGALAGIACLLLREWREISLIWSSRDVLFSLLWLGLVSSLALTVCMRVVWLRRILVLGSLFFVLGMPNSAYLVKLPDWIQVKEVTHRTTTADKSIDHPSASEVPTRTQPIIGLSRVVSGMPQSRQLEIDPPLPARIIQHSAKPGAQWSLKPLRRQ